MITSFSGSEFTFVSELFGLSPGFVFFGFLVLMAWTLVWKGFALWFAARSAQKVWFIALLVVNTAGILEIIYLVFFRKKEGQ
jgi:methionyl-tRNA synthetase